ncbi:MAG TPA: hypothetical protein PLL18_16920, partial [Flavobacteriales bacterium]|nr:hypothetical protein [Flavobacteriales bacterium]
LRFVYWFPYNQYQATNATLQVQVSSDGGTTFTTLETLSTIPTNTWVEKEYAIGSTSAQTVIRFKGTANSSLNGSDIAVDNLQIIPFEACPTPTSLAATPSAPGQVQATWNCAGCTGSSHVEYGPTGFTPGTGATAGANGTVVNVSGSPATVTGITDGTYDLYVRQDCGVDGFSGNAGPVAFTMVTTMDCSSAVDLSSLGLPIMDDSFTEIGSTTSATNHVTSSACFGYTPNKDIVFYQDVEPGATLHIGLWSYSSTLSVAYGESCPGTTSLACNPSGGGYFNAGTYVQNIGGYPTLVWTNASCETIRVYVVAEAITTGGDVYIFNYDYTAPAGGFCAVVANIAVNTVNTGTNAALSWDATCSGNVIVEYGPAGFTPGTDNTAG